MANSLSDEQWRTVLELAHAVAELPAYERLPFLKSNGSDAHIIQQVLALVDEFDPPATASTRVGTTIGRFHITGHIGRGGMGDVYSALDNELHRTVALKFLTPEVIGSAGALERFIREARTTSALNHPNIVTIHEVIRSESAVAIVMEFVEGVTLRQMCRQALPLPQVLEIGEQIAQALAAAHATGIVHRDVKPENIIVRPDGRVKIMDFGLARWTASDRQKSNFTTGVGWPAGTWRYMSPEQCKGEPVDSATDIFAFGLILYELCTGNHPFARASAFETMHAIVNEEPQSPSQWNPLVPDSLSASILVSLAKNRKLRPSAETLGNALAEFRSGRGISTVPRALPVRRTKPSYKYRGIIFLGLIVPLAGAAMWIWRVKIARNPVPEFRQVTTLVSENRASAAAISPDGKLAVYANDDGIFVRSLLSGETNSLRAPDDFVVVHLAWFADGASLVASGFSRLTNISSIWRISITGVPPRLLRASAIEGVPSPDGKKVAYLTSDKFEIWTMDAGGGDARKVVTAKPLDAYFLLLWSPDGRKFIVERRGRSSNRERYFDRFYESLDAQSGKTLASEMHTWIDSAAVLHDGRLLFLRLDEPVGLPLNELWEVRLNAATGAFRERPHRVASYATGEHIFDLSAADDGKQAMVLIRSDQTPVYVADFHPSPPRFDRIRRLTLDQRTNNPHAWTADSHAVIFESNRNGNFDIFKQRIDRRTPEAIVATPVDDVLPQLAPDGNTVLFATSSSIRVLATSRLNRVPVDGGAAEVVPLGGPLDEFRCAIGPGRRCVLRTTVGREYYVFYELDPVRGKGRELARVPWQNRIFGDWDLSPDGLRIAIPNHDPGSAKIRVVSLQSGAIEKDLVVSGLSDLTGVVWSADGKGWFTTMMTPIGRRMVYLYPDGRLVPLGNMYGWAVPSPDGQHVAFVDRPDAINAWTVNLP